MTNPPRKKGTAAETAVVKWLRDNGFGQADRQPLRGTRDCGDITACPGIIIEVKAHRLPTGHPTAGQLAEWMRQTDDETVSAGADVGILVVKRPGTTDVGRWHAYVTAWELAELIYPRMTSNAITSPAMESPVMLTLADLVALLRAAGWGDSLEEDAC